MQPVMLRGIPVSRGIARGKAYVVEDKGPLAIPRRHIDLSEVDAELARLEKMLHKAEAALSAVQEQVRRRIGSEEAGIFDAQILLLRDPAFIKRVADRCSNQRLNIEAALADVTDEVSLAFADIKDPYFRERAADVRDVSRRVLELLLKRQSAELFDLPAGAIVVATELFPSTTARMNLQAVSGIVTERGGRTSHASILTRSMGIPGVVAVKKATHTINSGDELIVDGITGSVFINPKSTVVREYDRLQADFAAYQSSLKEIIDLPAVTCDGVNIRLCANIGKLADAEAAYLFKADGIGLYRTEFNFLVRDRFPSEKEQFEIYKSVAERMHPRQVIIRVLDLGSDKALPYFPFPRETNPSLGAQGTRLLLKYPDILKTQLRAILRLSSMHDVGVLFPMISSIEEIAAAKKILEKVKQSLQRRRVPFNPDIPIGVMIEVPSAAILADRLAREVDFFSIGTNDLVQYLLTADRTSQEMADYYEPLHPAVLHTIKCVVDHARAANKVLSVCGEMAGNAGYTELLLGLGVRGLSIAPGEILEIKRLIRSMKMSEAEELAEHVLSLGTVTEIKRCLERFKARRAPAAA